MKTLDEIALRHGTDKASRHPLITGHNYAGFYDSLFAPFRQEPIKLLEVGVGGGESIRTWLEYFPRAMVFGVDVNPRSWSGPEERYTFVEGNQGNPSFWTDFHEKYGGAWDIIIDDGSHVSIDIITTWNSMWTHVNYGGLYAIEDLNVGYGAGSVFLREGVPSHMDFIKGMLDQINLHTEIEELHYFKELAVFRKFHLPHV